MTTQRRYTKLPPAIDYYGVSGMAFYCDICNQPDWVDLRATGKVREFFEDSETGKLVCINCAKLHGLIGEGDDKPDPGTLANLAAGWLDDHGYDGLCNDERDCWCHTLDLMPCDVPQGTNCRPGHSEAVEDGVRVVNATHDGRRIRRTVDGIVGNQNGGE